MIPAAVADIWLFWLAIIDVLATVYILPTVIGIARQVEGLGLVICLNAIPVGWPAALILACMMPQTDPVAAGACFRTQAPRLPLLAGGRQRAGLGAAPGSGESACACPADRRTAGRLIKLWLPRRASCGVSGR